MRTLPLSLVLALPLVAQTQSWSRLTSPTNPGPHDRHALVYDSARDRLVLCGGYSDQFTAATDTWEWNGSTWTQRSASSPVSVGSGISMAAAYDAARQVVMMVIGNGGTSTSTTWEWNGTAWSQRALPASPPGRAAFALAYDAARHRTVLFGGTSGNISHASDTWEYDGTTWTQRSSGGPRGRYSHAMVFDAARGVTLLYGGRTDLAPAGALADTWEWNGSYWLEHFGIAAPPARHDHQMAFDSTRGRVVLFGGMNAYNGGAYRNDTWEWDGTAWTQVTTSQLPASILDAALAYDPVRQRVVLFGGLNPIGGAVSAETWIYTAPTPSTASFTPFGSGCAGPVGTPQLGALASGRPLLGQTFVMQLTSLPTSPLNTVFGLLGSGNTTWNGQPLPVALDPLGMPGCQAWIAPEITYTLTNNAGSALWSLAVPNAPPLAGLNFYAQGAVLVPGFNQGGIVVSNAGHGVVGSQ